MEDADHVVDMLPVDGQAGVLGTLDRLENGPGIVVDIDAGDLGAGHHDVLHRGVLQVQNADDHVLMVARDRRVLVQHGLEFGDR